MNKKLSIFTSKKVAMIITFIVGVLLILLPTDFVNAEKFGDYEYSVTDDDKVIINKYCGNDNNVVIPSEINEKEVVGIQFSTFNNCSSLISVEIPASITYISNSAFMNCVNLTNISVDSQNEKYYDGGANAIIERKANNLIVGCGNTIIPDTVKSIDTSAFLDCQSLVSINIPDNVTNIGNGAFARCHNLKEVNISEGVSNIGDFAFSECNNIIELNIPGSVLNIGDHAFNDCSSLQRVIIPEGTIKIGQMAFDGCTELKSVKLSSSVEILGYDAFINCNNLSKIEIDLNNKYFYDGSENAIIRKDDDTLIYGCNNTKIPSTVKIIGKAAFFHHQIKSIDIPNSVQKIEDSAFAICYELESIEIPGSVSNIGAYTFHHCDNLKNVKILDGVKSIGKTAFAYCTNLESIIIPDSVENIEGYPFEGDYELTIYASKDSVAYKYAEMNGITVIDLDSKGTDSGSTKDDSIEYSDSNNDADKPQQSDNKPVSEASEKTKTISGVGKLSADGKVLTDLSGKKYYMADKLKKAELKKNLLVADSKTSGKFKVIGITKKSGKVTSGTVVYMNPYNKNTKKVSIPDIVKIGGVKFTVTSINKNAFIKNTKLTNITIGANITQIGANAFKGCKKLKTITIKTTKLKSIGSNAFKGINAKAKFKVPKKKLSKYTKMIKKAKAPKTVKVTK